jgi:hypothetical protein
LRANVLFFPARTTPLFSPSFFPPGTGGPFPAEGGYKGEKNPWFDVPVGFSDLDDFGGSAAGDGSVKA